MMSGIILADHLNVFALLVFEGPDEARWADEWLCFLGVSADLC